MCPSTRRQFLQHTTAIALGAAASPSAQAEAELSKLRIGCIGTGGRGNYHLLEALWLCERLEIAAVSDLYEPHRKAGQRNGWCANAKVRVIGRPYEEQRKKLDAATKPAVFYDYREMLAQVSLDAILIATPPHTHHAIVMDCLDAGKHVFVEIPLATTVTHARAIAQKAHETGLIVQVGHQQRYNPNYNLAYKRYREGREIGSPVGATLDLHFNRELRRIVPDAFDPEDRERIAASPECHLNWRLYMEPSGGPFLFNLAQSIDTINWFCGAPPVRVFTAGGIDYWKDGRTAPDNAVAVFEFGQRPGMAGYKPIAPRNELQDVEALNRGHSMRCTWTFGTANANRDRGECIHGDRGTAKFVRPHEVSIALEGWAAKPYVEHSLEERRRIISEVYHLDPSRPEELEKIEYYLSAGGTIIPIPEPLRNYPSRPIPVYAAGSEEDPEVHQFRAFAESIRSGETPRANVMVGLAAVIAGASAWKSYETGQPVDIDPAWMEFDFETPPITAYDRDVTAIEG